MEKIILPPKVKLIAAVMVTPDFPAERTDADMTLDWYAFNHSDYYKEEFLAGR